tara:strand:- start:1824 stop:2237 length:414 start_codon:yes stop_codon:yes gene_type:complete
MNFLARKVASALHLGVMFSRGQEMEVHNMKPLLKTLAIPALVLLTPVAFAGSEKDCLLEGTVQHGEQAGQNTTSVKIHSISQYDSDARCKIRSNQKMEFKLPQDTRLQNAPSGSDVKYRYRSDGSGQSDTQLISVGA